MADKAGLPILVLLAILGRCLCPCGSDEGDKWARFNRGEVC
jgi:hypothetical protein